MTDEQMWNEAIERGLEESYKVRASGYLGGNVEEKVRVGIKEALRVYVHLTKIEENKKNANQQN